MNPERSHAEHDPDRLDLGSKQKNRQEILADIQRLEQRQVRELLGPGAARELEEELKLNRDLLAMLDSNNKTPQPQDETIH